MTSEFNSRSVHAEFQVSTDSGYDSHTQTIFDRLCY